LSVYQLNSQLKLDLICRSRVRFFPMGHGNSNKLYVTHAEHSGLFGQHTASSSGFKAYANTSFAVLSFAYPRCPSKPEGLNPNAVTPFDCCSLSFQPFSHPVCARNADGTGTVFDLTNIIPWLK
jgi:peptidyl-prolyl cis-trans isomerase-like protein 2